MSAFSDPRRILIEGIHADKLTCPEDGAKRFLRNMLTNRR